MGRRLFIDCGGHDGCSVVKFLRSRPEFRVISFEPNPALAHYYRWLPTTLVPKAVATFDGNVAFTVDPIDADGSSTVPEKTVVWDRSLRNDECPTIEVPCTDLSRFLQRTVAPGDHVCLKLDIEGAEYAVLEKLMADGTIDLVDELLIEFHWMKCGVSEAAHLDLVQRLERRVPVDEWDAAPYAIHARRRRAALRRALLLMSIWPRHLAAMRRARRT